MKHRFFALGRYRFASLLCWILLVCLIGTPGQAHADKFFLGAGIYASGDSEALKQCEADRCRLEQEINGLNVQIAHKRHQISELYESIGEWKVAYGKLKDKNTKLETDLKTAQADLAKCESEKAALESQLKTAQSDLEACRLVEVRLKEKLHATEDKLADKDGQLKTATGELKEKTGELKKKTEKVSDLRADLARKDAAGRWSTWVIIALAIAAFLLLCALVISAFRYARRIHHNEHHLHECRREEEADEAKILALTERASKAEAEAKQLQREVDDLKKQLGQEGGTIGHLRRELDDARQQHGRDLDQIRLISTQAAQAEANATQLRGQVDHLWRETIQLTSWLNECRGSKAAADQAAAVATANLVGATRELAASKRDCCCPPQQSPIIYNPNQPGPTVTPTPTPSVPGNNPVGGGPGVTAGGSPGGSPGGSNGGSPGGGPGGSPAGGSPSGGSPAGGSPAGGSPAGGSPAGGSPAGGSPAGGSPTGGSPGGSPAGGSGAGGAGGAGGSGAGGTAGGSPSGAAAAAAAPPSGGGGGGLGDLLGGLGSLGGFLGFL